MIVPVVLNQLIHDDRKAFQISCQIINVGVSKQCILSPLFKNVLREVMA